ncbi:XRE family transcriptional regulator [Bombilactobacillus bombi]|jgi:transcriptional regulator with XRE-family HTH domain|uniref:XRE family transcriptional regulator n=1 Tax=Bombilactobacillus bombi TaxID=1303590 RepID=A0A347SU39_9LACO|nr:helix-turn-helix transcriptional regulator [Bombilactobacillus bombi]AXX65548.1 XRE family transcriptional regulator [Bombilactobacillus bombi]RHW52049.1 XRE family transcriptional regulator [Bombilactobacillus bombi]
MATIGERIREYRNQKNLTQKELGQLIHQSPQVISNYERGYTTPNSITLKNIADILNVSMDNLTATKNSDKHTIEQVDLNDDNLSLTYKGQPVSNEDLEIIRRFLRGSKSDK